MINNSQSLLILVARIWLWGTANQGFRNPAQTRHELLLRSLEASEAIGLTPLLARTRVRQHRSECHSGAKSATLE